MTVRGCCAGHSLIGALLGSLIAGMDMSNLSQAWKEAASHPSQVQESQIFWFTVLHAAVLVDLATKNYISFTQS